MYNPITISNYFLKTYGQENDITPMKLVKLVYISHGWYLGITENALIDENPEAWKYGPVIPSVYHYFKEFGGSPIRVSDFPSDPDEVLSKDTKTFLDKIWEVYGNFTAIELSAKTHEINTPWYISWNKLQELNSNSRFGIFSHQIPDNLIKDYYQTKFNINKGKTVA
jgi:uncharacterized phage-associated protein